MNENREASKEPVQAPPVYLLVVSAGQGLTGKYLTEALTGPLGDRGSRLVPFLIVLPLSIVALFVFSRHREILMSPKGRRLPLGLLVVGFLVAFGLLATGPHGWSIWPAVAAAGGTVVVGLAVFDGVLSRKRGRRPEETQS